MGDRKWTNEQQKAIEARNCSLLVAAAAGAGKTAVLVERIIQRITDDKNPIDIDSLLVVTFTNAAASEMRERIGSALSYELEKNPGLVELQRQMTLLGKAEITTIHAFCLGVIRNNFHVVDLDPAFRIADETESILLKQEALEEVFEDMYEDEDSGEFLNLVECYGGGRGDSALQDMVLGLYEFAQSTPYPWEWIDSMVEKFNVEDDFDFNSSIWAKVLMENIKIEVSGLWTMMEKALVNIQGVSGLEPYLDHFKGELDSLKRLLKCCETSWDDLYNGFSTLDFEKLPTCKKVSDKEAQEKAKGIRDEVKKRIKDLKGGVLSSPSKEIGLEMKKLYPSMKCLGGLTFEFSKKYSAKKKEKGVIDFNDIEHYTIDILTARDDNGNVIPSKASIQYKDKFEEILIDEYQDSNMVQELILTTISRNDRGRPNIFMVGDVKQSIYRFRQAKPELFLGKYNTYSDKEGEGERRILLYKNFRSRKEIIEGVNYIFKGIMSKNIGELDYDDNEKLNPGAEFDECQDESRVWGGPVEVHIIESKKDSEEDLKGQDDEAEGENTEDVENEEDVDSVQLEARMVAKRIKGLVHGDCKKYEVYDKNLGSYRPLEYKDVVILMRAAFSSAPVFMEELSKMGIPVYADTGGGYFEVTEVQTIMSLLQVVDNPMQDIPLLTVLRSPIYSFTPEELCGIRVLEGKECFYEALKIKASSEEGDTYVKAARFLKDLGRWRDKSVNMSISQFIWYLYSDTGYYAYTGAMPGGVKRQANLRVLFERARQYEDTSFKGLFNFVNFINKLKKNNGDMGSAKVLGENENVVRIMSIHKSKGLEFPVVIVCGLGKKFNLRDLNKSILLHHELGLGPDFVDSKRRYYYQTVIKQALRKKIKLESFSEEMRILYVALTRAKEKLILTGTTRNIGKSCAKWAASIDEEKVPEYEIISGGNFLDWICPVLMKHSDCEILRKTAEVEVVSPVIGPSRWEVKLWDRKEVLSHGEDMTKDAAVAGLQLEHGGREQNSYTPEIKRRLEWEYTYEKSSKLPGKLSVTELKRRFGSAMEDEYTQNIFVPPLAKMPYFLQETLGELTGARKGTIMHLVMQHIDLKSVPSEDDIESLVHSLIRDEFLTPAEGKSVDTGKIGGFFKSPLGERLLRSGSAKREVPFNIEIESTEVYSDLPEGYKDEHILLQGIIDCYFEEPDGLVLIDYKTDYVTFENIDTIREKYRIQVEYYSKALERIAGKRVKERYIYLFSNGNILEY